MSALQAPSDDQQANNLRRQQEERALALATVRKLRKDARAEIERLIEFLDASDPYVSTELEEQGDDVPVDDNELEPSLGFLDRPANQDRLCAGSHDDREHEHDGREPSLGFLENHPYPTYDSLRSRDKSGNQERLCQGASSDLEEQCEDEGDVSDTGIADEEGRMEQLAHLFEYSMVRVE